MREKRPGTERPTPKLHKSQYKSREMYTGLQIVITRDKICLGYCIFDGSTAPTNVRENTAIAVLMCSVLTCVSRKLACVSLILCFILTGVSRYFILCTL